eukprot:scaffold4285_cov109-Isochrysis_galbana.AAC.7
MVSPSAIAYPKLASCAGCVYTGAHGCIEGGQLAVPAAQQHDALRTTPLRPPRQLAPSPSGRTSCWSYALGAESRKDKMLWLPDTTD